MNLLLSRIPDIDKGVYILQFYLSRPSRIIYKKFCSQELPTGYYYYFGSAQKNLYHRIARHAKKRKKKYWHIDYLSSNKDFKLIHIWIFPDLFKSYECEFLKQFQNNCAFNHILKNFGNGDCKNKCESHLLYSVVSINENDIEALGEKYIKLNFDER